MKTKAQQKTELLAMLDARRVAKPLASGHTASKIRQVASLIANEFSNTKMQVSDLLAELHGAFYYELSESQLVFASKVFKGA